jgi:hypothetical protein
MRQHAPPDRHIRVGDRALDNAAQLLEEDGLMPVSLILGGVD